MPDGYTLEPVKQKKYWNVPKSVDSVDMVDGADFQYITTALLGSFW